MNDETHSYGRFTIVGLDKTAADGLMERMKHRFRLGAELGTSEVACPYCKVAPNYPCVTRQGSVRSNHKRRGAK